jgi:hypothetical protein
MQYSWLTFIWLWFESFLIAGVEKNEENNRPRKLREAH